MLANLTDQAKKQLEYADMVRPSVHPPGRVMTDPPRDEPAGSSLDSYDSYPFEVWYRDDTHDSADEDSQAWVDPEVRKISSILTRSSALLGIAKAICQRGPWSVCVSPCRHRESVSTASLTEGKPCFYLYDTLHSKLGIKLPFTHFEQAILQVLNVAPSQLHPNSWAFVRAFELLCEDLGKAPTLGVFFWLFTVKKTDKVGWTSLCSRPKRKLFKPFLESYNSFKTRFFKVTPSDSGPNLLVDCAGRPFFPLSWTRQPVVSVAVCLKDLEKWEDEFARELGKLPLLPNTDIIKGVGYSSYAFRNLKRRAPQMAEEEEQQPAASVEPLVAAEPSPQQGDSDETSNTPSLVVLNQFAHTSSPIIGGINVGSSLGSKERPSKRPHIEETIIAEDAEADKGLAYSFENNKVKQLGVVGTCNALQQYATYSLILAKAAEKEFGRLESQNKSCTDCAEKDETEFLNLSKAFAEAEVKINSFQSANAGLEEDLQRTIIKNKDLARANF
ncbi:hypothetical protein CR513_19733, partial [Mucuna pruriens]